MYICEAKVLIARETGWSLDYIGQLDQGTARTLVTIIQYQRSVEHYELGRLFAMCMATYANSVSKRHYHIHDFVGHGPKELKGVTTLTQRESKPYTIVLDDGNSYELGPLNLNIMEEVETKFDKPWTELFAAKTIRIGHIKYALWCMFKRKYPDMTEEQCGDLLTAKIFGDNQNGLIKHLMT